MQNHSRSTIIYVLVAGIHPGNSDVYRDEHSLLTIETQAKARERIHMLSGTSVLVGCAECLPPWIQAFARMTG